MRPISDKSRSGNRLQLPWEVGSPRCGGSLLKKFIPAAFIAAVTILLSAACSAAAPSGHTPAADPAGIAEHPAADSTPVLPPGPPAHPKFKSSALNGTWIDPHT